MNINTRAKALIGAVAIGGAAIAMGGAFTAGGIDGTAVETNPVFIGGSTNQTVQGATLEGVDYTLSTDGSTVNSVDLRFSTATWDAVKDETFTVVLDTVGSECIADATTPTMVCTFATPVATTGTDGQLDITIASHTNVANAAA